MGTAAFLTLAWCFTGARRHRDVRLNDAGEIECQ
jgi:hypothetical protein